MKFKDFFRTTVFKIKNRKRKILIDKGTMINRSFLEGKNILGLNNDIVNSYIGYGTYIGSSRGLSRISWQYPYQKIYNKKLKVGLK